MKFLLLLLSAWLLFSAALVAGDGAQVYFSRTFPGSTPPFFSVVVDEHGATYNETTDSDNAETLKLEASVIRQIFDLSARLDHFKKPLESSLKVANMGQKVFRWDDGAEHQETSYNYSTSDDAKALSDIFEHIADSTRMLLDLKRVMRHDKLGVNDAILRIQSAFDARHLVGTPQYLPVLEQVAANELFINMARERAARMAEAIRAGNP